MAVTGEEAEVWSLGLSQQTWRHLIFSYYASSLKALFFFTVVEVLKTCMFYKYANYERAGKKVKRNFPGS